MSTFLRLQSNWSAATITNCPTVPLLVNLGVKSHLSRCGVHDCNMFSVEERPMSPWVFNDSMSHQHIWKSKIWHRNLKLSGGPYFHREALYCELNHVYALKKTNPADRGLLGTSVIVAISIINTRIRHTLVPSPTCPCGILKVPCLQQVSCIRNIAFCWDSMILHWPRWMLDKSPQNHGGVSHFNLRKQKTPHHVSEIWGIQQPWIILYLTLDI